MYVLRSAMQPGGSSGSVVEAAPNTGPVEAPTTLPPPLNEPTIGPLPPPPSPPPPPPPLEGGVTVGVGVVGVFTLTLTVLLLLSIFESAFVLVAVAVFTIACPAIPLFTLAMRWSVVVAPLCNVPITHCPVEVA